MKRLYQFFLSVFEYPPSAGLVSFVVYAILASQRGFIFGVSSSPYFNYLADAFLHGQFALRLIPANVHDLALFNGHYFMYWPPFPAVLLMPFVAILGVGFSDVFFTLMLGALNVALFAYLLRIVDHSGFLPIDPQSRGILTLFLAFGTVHLFLASLGIVWFTSQIVAFLCSLLAFIAANRLKGLAAFLLTGIALGCAILTRNHLVFLGIALVFFLLRAQQTLPLKKKLLYLGAAALPVLLAVIFAAYYNFHRFGSIFEYGLSYQDFGSFFQPDFEKYGHFSLHYLWTNFYYNFIYYPFPASDLTLMGGSLFLLSPLFLAGFWAFRDMAFRKSAFILGLTILAVTLPILLNIGTGWKTFGPRYTLDFAPALLLLTAAGMRRWPRWLCLLLVAVSIAQFILGTLYFIRVT